MKTEQATATFTGLRDILARHAPRLDVERDDPDAYALNAGYSEKWGRVIFFGSAEIKKRYVSYHLFPVYMFPDLLEDLPPELEKRMQGKSCFNFTKITDSQREELARLTEQGFRRFEAEGLV